MNVLEKIKSKRTHLNIKERADMSSAMLDQPVTLQIEQGSASGNCHKEA